MSTDGMTYRERREARAERLRDWAEGQDRKGDARLASYRQTADMIPLAQPMMPSHYSYKSDRNRRDRMIANFEKGYEAKAKAESMRNRADNIEAAADHAIYSDDDDAIERLAERIAGLEAERDRIKAYNASCRKGKADESLLDAAQVASLESVRRHCPYQLGKQGQMPGYALSNLSGNIAKQRARLAGLQRKAEQS
jgi:hypothetical protein